MKQILSLLILMSISASSFSASTDWKFLGVSEYDPGSIMYVNEKSIEKNGDYVKFSSKLDTSKSTRPKLKNVKYSIGEVEMICSNATYRQGDSTIFWKNGKKQFVGTDTPGVDLSWNSISSDSPLAKLYNQVCN